jgi:TRAP-type C4-dicarboxylate transport system permease small subunit
MSIIRLNDLVARFLMVLAAVWAFILCFIILADVVGRSFFDVPLHGTTEIVANSIVMIVFLQAGYAIRSNAMLRTEVLVDVLGPNAKRVALGFADLLGAIFFLIIVIGAFHPAIRAFVNGEFEGEGALRVPVWPTRFVILIGAALAIVNYLVLFYVDVFAPERHDDFGEPVRH